MGQSNEAAYKQIYNPFYGGDVSEEDSEYVKIFEYVKGANITGTAPPNETVKINTTILISQGRTFEYFQLITSDSEGRYEFIAPYSTEGRFPGKPDPILLRQVRMS